MSFLDKLFKKEKEIDTDCEVPLCENQRDLKRNWPFCTECMVNTVRRFMYMEGTLASKDVERADYWIHWLCIRKNRESLLAKEKEDIESRGINYNRNSLEDDEIPHDIDADLKDD